MWGGVSSFFQVNRVGDLKLSLEEQNRALSVTRSQLAAVRREARVESTAQEEKRRFEAHRPSRYYGGERGAAVLMLNYSISSARHTLSSNRFCCFYRDTIL